MIGWKSMESEEGQALMEAHVEKTLYQNNIEQEEQINGMMRCSAGGCNFDEQSLVFEFPVEKWQTNRVGQLHGGIICTAFDITVAALARFYIGENFAPTVSLNVNYIRPAREGDTLVVKAKITSIGRRLTHLTAEAHSKKTGKVLASAQSVYINVDTDKEHK